MVISCLMKNRDLVLIYLKYSTNTYEVYIPFIIEFSKDIFKNLDYIIFFI